MNINRFLTALFGTLLFRYPNWLFITNASHIQKVQVWDSDFALLCHWDCAIFSKLVENLAPGAFFPLLPWLAKAIIALASPFTVISPTLAILIVSNIFTIVGGMLTLFLAEHLWSEDSAQKVFGFSKKSWLLLAVVSFFPSGHFWLQGYSEAVYYTFLVAGLLLLCKQHPYWGVSLLGLTAISRPPGIWTIALFSGLMLLHLVKPNRVGFFANKPLTYRSFFMLNVLLFLPFALFLLWNYVGTGNPIHFLSAQSGWGREFSITTGLHSNLPTFDRATVFLYLAIASAIYYFRKNDTPQVALFLAALGVLHAEIPLFIGGFYSYHRFMSVNLGIFILLTELGMKKPRVFWIWIIWSLAQLAAVSHRASFGGWTG